MYSVDLDHHHNAKHCYICTRITPVRGRGTLPLSTGGKFNSGFVGNWEGVYPLLRVPLLYSKMALQSKPQLNQFVLACTPVLLTQTLCSYQQLSLATVACNM